MDVLKLIKVRKKFGKKEVLRDVNFEVQSGEFCLLVGQNGAGKSTVLNLVNKDDFHDSGEILFFGEDILKKDYDYAQRMCFVHEKINYKLPVSMDKFIKIYSREFKTWDQKLFDKMVKDRKIDLSSKFPNYSRGQKMQISLMIAIARKPEVLLLDEITSVIDLAGQKYFLSLLRSLCNEGHTVILTTNILSEAQSVCDRLIYINDGAVEFTSSKEDLVQNYVKLVIPAAFISEFKMIPGISLLESNSKQGIILFSRDRFAGNLPEGCFELVPAFEDIFMHIYNFKEGELENAS